MNDKLQRIQTKLKAPKDLVNKFGGYKYRNAEGICEAVKPYLAEEKCYLTLDDEIVEVGGRVYVKATATLGDCESSRIITVSAYAREAESKKGMDDAQVTGATSSYARKYALNGLFLLDDTKDVDSNEYQEEAERRATKDQINKSKIGELDIKGLRSLADKKGQDLSKLFKIPVEELTFEQWKQAMDALGKMKDKT